jgi:hypothetical protein
MMVEWDLSTAEDATNLILTSVDMVQMFGPLADS